MHLTGLPIMLVTLCSLIWWSCLRISTHDIVAWCFEKDCWEIQYAQHIKYMSGSIMFVTRIFTPRGFNIKCHQCRPQPAGPNATFVGHVTLCLMNGPLWSVDLCYQQHHTEWAEHSDLDSQAQSRQRMKIDRNVMNCLGILSAIRTDIGMQFRGDIIPKLPTATVERLSRTQCHPINDTKRRQQMVMLQPVMKSSQFPFVLIYCIGDTITGHQTWL